MRTMGTSKGSFAIMIPPQTVVLWIFLKALKRLVTTELNISRILEDTLLGRIPYRRTDPSFTLDPNLRTG
jgi:hypothetical protein